MHLDLLLSPAYCCLFSVFFSLNFNYFSDSTSSIRLQQRSVFNCTEYARPGSREKTQCTAPAASQLYQETDCSVSGGHKK